MFLVKRTIGREKFPFLEVELLYSAHIRRQLLKFMLAVLTIDSIGRSRSSLGHDRSFWIGDRHLTPALVLFKVIVIAIDLEVPSVIEE